MEKNRKNKFLTAAFISALYLTLLGCSKGVEPVSDQESVTMMVAAAASLENCYTEVLIPAFEAKYPYITVEGTYDSSGKLQTQIEEGLEADVFMSAAQKQMNALVGEGLVDREGVVDLLENKLVLIVPVASDSPVTGFDNLTSADIIAIGDSASVPAGQYAQEALTSLGIWEEVSAKASLGTNVTEVLSWVAAGSAEAGIVYATDAAGSKDVIVVAQAPEGSFETPVIYPAGMVTTGAHSQEAQLFLNFLQSEEAMEAFTSYGFTSNLK